VLDGVLDQLERDPAARFVLDGQTVLLEDYLQARPENRDRVAALVQSGALEIGPWYVLTDLLIPSEASLLRNLEEGRRDAARFGRALPVLYSPDAFGHPASLPALAARNGIHWAVIRRGIGRPGGTDRDLYKWGRTLLVWHLPAAGYDLAAGLGGTDRDLERQWAALKRELLPRAVCDQIAVPLGADHHAMHPEVAGLCARLQSLESRHAVRVSGLVDYFAAVERSKPKPPVLRGEQRRSDGHAWVLQGVHGSRSRLKRHHGRAELVLSRIAEPLARLASRRGSDQRGPLRLAWRILLQCQFHDTLAGTTSDAVQEEQSVRLGSVESIAGEIVARGFAELAGYDPDLAREARRAAPSLVLWNPVGRTREAIVTAELTCFRRDVLVGPPSARKARSGAGYRPLTLRSPAGDSIPVQVLSVRPGQERRDARRHYPDQDEVDRVWVAFRSPRVPGRGVLLLSPTPGRAQPGAAELTVRPGVLANRFLEVRVTRIGNLTLTDRRTGQVFAGLGELRDEPDRGDLYSFSRGPGREAAGGRPGAQRIIAAGPLVAAVETRWRQACAGPGRLDARLIVALQADSPIVRLRLDFDNQATDHRLRARFPLGITGTVLAGASGGHERRGPAMPRHDALEHEASTAPAQRYLAAAKGVRRFALLAPGFFEYEWTADGVLSVTLTRSVGELSKPDLPERPGHAAWPLATPLAQELGPHTIDLALVLPRGETSEAALERVWQDAFLPLQTCFLRDYVTPATA